MKGTFFIFKRWEETTVRNITNLASIDELLKLCNFCVWTFLQNTKIEERKQSQKDVKKMLRHPSFSVCFSLFEYEMQWRQAIDTESFPCVSLSQLFLM